MGNCGSGGTSTRSPRDRQGQRRTHRVLIDPAEAAIGDGKPLQIEPWNSQPPVYKSEIDQMRREFWDTAPAYEGRGEIWDALKAACDAPETELAQAIITASEIKLPNGSLTNCFDTTGAKYNIPQYCISYPRNMLANPPAPAPTSPAPVARTQETTDSPPILTAQSSAVSVVSSGPSSPIPEGEGMKIKCRLSLGQDETLVFAMSDIALRVKEQIFEMKKIPIARMRIYFVGKMVPDRLPLSSLDLRKNDMLQIMVLPVLR